MTNQHDPHAIQSLTGPPLDWLRAHEELSALARNRARLDFAEGVALLFALRSTAHLQLGFATFAEYVERVLGYSPRWTAERLRVAEALESLPELAHALRDGSLSWSAVRELSRVAVADTEREWLRVARERSIRQVEELVSGHDLGDAPGAPSGHSSSKHVLRFEVSADTYAAFREAVASLRRSAGGPLDDDAVLLLMARQALGGSSDPGRASYQIAMTICEECRRGWQRAAGQSALVGTEIVEMAHCDAQPIGRVGPAARMDPSDELEAAGAVAVRARRARQDIPPAERRAIMHRDGGKCIVPGCRSGTFLDVHHLDLRSEGGGHDPDRMVIVCGAHHRAVHRGQLMIDGSVSTGLTFRHADGSRYGTRVEPRAADMFSQAFRALRNLGFREDETRSALQRVRKMAHVGDSTMEMILRSALAALSNGATGHRMPVG